jgi:hypothetical protein
MVQSPTAEELAALLEALAVATRQSEEATHRNAALLGENRVLRAECDLLKERLNKFMRQIFAAKSEVSGLHQKDMFFNEAEALGAAAPPAEEDDGEETIAIPGHQRAKRGRKPLDPALPREVVRHELPEAERVCPHDGATLQEIGVEASEQLN